MPKIKKMTEEMKIADDLLAQIADIQVELAEIGAASKAEMDQVKAKWKAEANQCKERLKAVEKDLVKLSKTHRATLFAAGDRLDLQHGALLHQVEMRVRRAKSVTVELLKGLGFADGVKVSESVNWDAIEKWPDEKLVAIGTERKERETFEYETVQ